MLAADALQVPNVVLIGGGQQQVALVRQVLEAAAVDELDHVPDDVEVYVRDDDLVALALAHVVLEHGAEHGGPRTQNSLKYFSESDNIYL